MTDYLIVHRKTGVIIAEPRDKLEAQMLVQIDPENTKIVAKLEKKVAKTTKKGSK